MIEEKELTEWELECLNRSLINDAAGSDQFKAVMNYSIDTTQSRVVDAKREDGQAVQLKVIEHSSLIRLVPRGFYRDVGMIEVLREDGQPLGLTNKGWRDLDDSLYHIEGLPNTPQQAEKQWA